jgi:hypothetical protein
LARIRLPDWRNGHYLGDTATTVAVKSRFKIAVKKHLAGKHQITTEDTDSTEELIIKSHFCSFTKVAANKNRSPVAQIETSVAFVPSAVKFVVWRQKKRGQDCDPSSIPTPSPRFCGR